tara:strand:- start:7531 stop:8796 length:1266 start_codon:yes stop_codon:yes gene_type:complete
MNEFSVITSCRICQSKSLTSLLLLEPQYLTSSFVKTNENNPMSKIKIPLTLLLCDNCGLVQLKETTDPNLLFINYFFRTSKNHYIKENFQQIIQILLKYVKITNDDFAIDIGANNCEFISMFPKFLKKIAIEPAKNISWEKTDSSITIINDFFQIEPILKITKGKKAKIITATAMFYDFTDPNLAIKNIKSILDKDGICAIQVSYLLDTVRDLNPFDIVHEHLTYYSLKSLDFLMQKNDMSIIDASTNDVNGGSLLVFVTHKENSIPKSKNVESILSNEEKWKLDSPETFLPLKNNIKDIVKKTQKFLSDEINLGGNIIGFGASTKGNSILQICGMNKSFLRYIAENNEDKIGLCTLGTDFKIISENDANDLKPSLLFVLPWNFKKEIIKNQQEFIKKDGKLLFIMPYLHFIDKNGENLIK